MRRIVVENLSLDRAVHVPRGEGEANLRAVSGALRQGKADLPGSGRIALAVRRDTAQPFPREIDFQVGVDPAVLGGEDVGGQREMHLVPHHVDGQARPAVDVRNLRVGRKARDVKRDGGAVRKALFHLVAGQHLAFRGGGGALRGGCGAERPVRGRVLRAYRDALCLPVHLLHGGDVFRLKDGAVGQRTNASAAQQTCAKEYREYPPAFVKQRSSPLNN